MEQPISFRNPADRPSGPVDFLGDPESSDEMGPIKDSEISAKVNGLVWNSVTGIARLSAIAD